MVFSQRHFPSMWSAAACSWQTCSPPGSTPKPSHKATGRLRMNHPKISEHHQDRFADVYSASPPPPSASPSGKHVTTVCFAGLAAAIARAIFKNDGPAIYAADAKMLARHGGLPILANRTLNERRAEARMKPRSLAARELLEPCKRFYRLGPRHTVVRARSISLLLTPPHFLVKSLRKKSCETGSQKRTQGNYHRRSAGPNRRPSSCGGRSRVLLDQPRIEKLRAFIEEVRAKFT